MSLTFFLRRNNGSRDEYLYLPAEIFDGPNLSSQLVKPKLPGNDSTTLTGNGSPNFILNLGMMQSTIRVTGNCLPTSPSDYPTLTSPDIHILSTAQTVSSDQTGIAMRDALYDFVADQANSTYSSFALGWPGWSASENPRIWYGEVEQLQSRQVPYEPDQFMFSLSFVVGST